MKAANSIQVVFLVDNTTDSLSSSPGSSRPSSPAIVAAYEVALRQVSLLCGSWPVLPDHRALGIASRTLLFDTGPDEWVFERNVTRLGVPSARSRRWCSPMAIGTTGAPCRARCR